MPAALMYHEEDPREVLQRKAGNLDIDIFGNDVLVAIYQRPEKTSGGIIMTDVTRKEDIYQGKIGLVLKIGPVAFVDKDGNTFRDIRVGDWIVFRPSDGWQVLLNTKRSNPKHGDRIDCRIIGDIYIRGRVPHPDDLY